jgi:hypothetical protein
VKFETRKRPQHLTFGVPELYVPVETLTVEKKRMMTQHLEQATAPADEPIRVPPEPTRLVAIAGAVVPDFVAFHIGTDGSNSTTDRHPVQRRSVLATKHALVTRQIAKQIPIYLCETVMSGPPESTGFLPVAEFEPSKGQWGFDSPHHLLFDDMVARNKAFLTRMKGKGVLVNVITVDGGNTGCTEAELFAAIERFKQFEREAGTHTFVAELPPTNKEVTRAISATHDPMELLDGNYERLFSKVLALIEESTVDITAPKKWKTLDQKDTTAPGA